MNTKLIYIATAAIALLVTKFVVVDMLSGVKSHAFFVGYEITQIQGKSIQNVKSQKRILSSTRGENDEHWNVLIKIISTEKSVKMDMSCQLSFKEVTIAYENSSDSKTFPLTDGNHGIYLVSGR